MQYRLASRFAVCLSACVALAAFACTAATTTVPGGTSSGGTPTSKDAGDGTPTTDAGNTDAAPAPSDQAACGKRATAQDCDDCCIATDPAAYDAADQVWSDCICAATACQTACVASICAAADNQNEPTAACQTCLDSKGDACNQKAGATCDANAACKAVDTCRATYCDALAGDGGK